MNTRNTLILLIVFGALLAVAVYLSRNETESVDLSEGTATATPAPLIELEAASVQEVTGETADGSVTMSRVAGGWEVNGESAAEHVDGTLSRLANPTVVRDMPPGADPEVYGFATPSMTITLTTQDGAETILEVGDETLVDSNVYLRKSGEGRIVVVSNFEVNELKGWIDTPPLAPTPTPEGAGDDTGDADSGEADEDPTDGAEGSETPSADEGTTTPEPGDDEATQDPDETPEADETPTEATDDPETPSATAESDADSPTPTPDSDAASTATREPSP